MARYAKSQGKGPKKKKRDQLKASVHVNYESDSNKASERFDEYNDGDPTVYIKRKWKDYGGKGQSSSSYRHPNAANPIKGKPKNKKVLPPARKSKETYYREDPYNKHNYKRWHDDNKRRKKGLSNL